MSRHSLTSRKTLIVAGAATTALAAALLNPFGATAATAAVTTPPVGAEFDYQIGGAYTPPSGVGIVSRDHTADPVDGLYNICYVNAFQTQPGATSEWKNLLLKDEDGNVVYDDEWAGEAILDITTKANREAIAEKVNGWIDDCAAKGFQAVEPDNLDTYDRFDDLLTASQAQAMIQLLSAHAHEKGLAIAQKNASELAGNREANGLDFAVAEECGKWDECGDYAEAFDDKVVVIEYDDEGMANACSGWGDELSIVKRDLDVVTPDDSAYVRETC
ncbi:endo alpha-1,4 polygalactosaminidase [Streptomyces sp. CRN 30]|uniref:endo alpha-1,4 polygalactosaminidase n=1 Tax=Streptomyces sp. CRN 30 TaxID=3075613 RepID=UPI002A80A1AA|nr:endo alpha-1,4 polygalactosaminidase [Streptomyces sp. CRN 30]